MVVVLVLCWKVFVRNMQRLLTGRDVVVVSVVVVVVEPLEEVSVTIIVLVFVVSMTIDMFVV